MDLNTFLPDTASRVLALILASMIVGVFTYAWRAYRKKRKEESELEISYINQILELRNKYRVKLTQLISIYYEKTLDSDSIYHIPQVQVLTKKEYLPENPVLISDLDKMLKWEEEGPKVKKYSNFSSIIKKSASGRQLYNGFIYRILEINNSNLIFTKGRYFDFLNTCEYLSYELAEFIHDNDYFKDLLVNYGVKGINKIAGFLIENPDSIKLRTSTNPFDFTSRYSAFGTCTLVVLKRTNKESIFILNVRSNQLTETPGLLHVIPAGTFQPIAQGNIFHKVEFSFSENIFREFIEELIEDIHIRQNYLLAFDYEKLYGEGLGKKFRDKIIKSNNFELLYLGTVIDPINLKPEIITVLLLHEGYADSFLGNNPSWETEGAGLRQVHFTEERLKEILENEDNKFVPTGKAHIWLVKKHFHYINNRLNSI